MKILITGATGMIGQHVVKLCLDRGHFVNYLTTSKSKIEDKPYYKGFLWNPEKEEIDVRCIENVDAIINLVGSNIASRWTSSYKKTIIKSRTETADLLYKTLKKSDENVKTIVSASGISIYPSSFSKFYTEENKKTDGSFLAEVVLKWEAAVDQFQKIGIDVAKLRIGLVLAKEGGALPKLAQPVEYYIGAPLGTGQQWQSWIHIKDLACLFVYAVENQLEGVYNAATGNPHTNESVTKSIGAVLDKPILPVNVPAFVLKLMLGEMSTVVLGSQMVSNNKIVSTGFRFEYDHLKPALEDLLND